jgi:hypothetical protein
MPNVIIPYNSYSRTTTGSSAANTRESVTSTTGSLAANGVVSLTLTGAKSYALYSIQVSAGAWVTCYINSAARTADASRLITIDPSPGSGVIAEAITTIAGTVYFTPAVFGYNGDATPSTNLYLKVVNNSGATANISFTISYLKLE